MAVVVLPLPLWQLNTKAVWESSARAPFMASSSWSKSYIWETKGIKREKRGPPASIQHEWICRVMEHLADVPFTHYINQAIVTSSKLYKIQETRYNRKLHKANRTATKATESTLYKAFLQRGKEGVKKQKKDALSTFDFPRWSALKRPYSQALFKYTTDNYVKMNS